MKPRVHYLTKESATACHSGRGLYLIPVTEQSRVGALWVTTKERRVTCRVCRAQLKRHPELVRGWDPGPLV